MEAYQWEARPLAIVGSGRDVDEYRSEVLERAAELQDRDMVVWWSDGGDLVQWRDGLVTRFEASAKVLDGLAGEQPAVVLIGKDGGIKLAEPIPYELDLIFALIDAMPMRQNEMRARSD